MPKTIKTRNKVNTEIIKDKTINGKVRKVRINIKSCAKLMQQNNSVKKNDEPASDIPASDTDLQKTSKSKRRLEESKFNEKLSHEMKNNSRRIVDKTSGLQQKPNNLSPVTTRSTIKLRKVPVNEKEGDSFLQSKNTRKFDIRLKNIDKCGTNAKLLNKYKEKGKIQQCNKRNISDKFEKLLELNINGLNRKTFTEPSLIRAKTGLQINKANFYIPEATKRFVVKLQKNPVIKKTKRNVLGTLKHSNTSNFVVKLKKIENSISKPTSVTTANDLKLNSQKHLINENELTGIKQIAELSLRKNKNKTIMDDTICFEPVRNSTLLPFGKNKHRHKPNDEIKITTPSAGRSSFRNLTNKSDEIENILISLDDEEDFFLNSPQNKHDNRSNEKIETQTNNSITDIKSKKFFHREKVMQKNILKEHPKQKTTSGNTKKRRFYTKRSTVVKPDQIYEFFSQSQTSDIAKHADPTADIVKKLIDQGKVRVATNSKGTGKPKFKRVKGQRKQNKENKAFKQIKVSKKKTMKVKFTEENRNDTVEEDQNFEDHFDNVVEQFTDNNHYMEQNNYTHTSFTTEQEGTFSRLARSVIINQAGRSDWQQKHPSALSRKDFNLISTPKNKGMRSPQTALEMDLSPIVMARPKPPGMTSPWRVNEDTHLPATFNFCRSSGNLPSFSSDFIPSTPRKEKKRIYLDPPLKSPDTDIAKKKSPTKYNDDIENFQQQASKLSEPPVLSSFSSNDSNGENMPPPRRASESFNENEIVFNLEQSANHHRTLNHRSPLKTLNIIEVLHLPPYQHMKKKTIAKDQPEMVGDCDDNIKESHRREQSVTTVRDDQRNGSLTNSETRSTNDLFGFEDYLSQTEFSSQENSELNDDTRTNAQNQTIHEKLQDLRKLKPDQIEFQQHTKPIKTMPLFEDDNAAKVDGMRQRGIKEMLCSTMLHPQPSTSKEALRQQKNANLVPTFEDDLGHTEFFNDPEPETTFNEKEAHRTYIRPYKRKPRLRESKCFVYLDSDVSEDESDCYESKKREHSRGSNSSSEHAPKKKRNRKTPKENLELVEFMKEFNEMCKDVDSYKLVVEKSK